MRTYFNKLCRECHSSHIMLDEAKGEIFCLDCGLVHEDRYAMFSLSKYIEMINTSEARSN